MSIPVPDLDDRGFADLVAEALAHVRRVDPTWTDLSVHDPGVVLIEGFAHLTDVLLYRLNRVPERLYAVFLGLLGATVGPPRCAETTVRFTRTGGTGAVTIPRGTRITVSAAGGSGGDGPTFQTQADALIPEGQSTVDVLAADAVFHDAVVVGTGTGGPGQSFALPGAPILDGPVVVGVQVPAARGAGAEVLVAGQSYRPCREVEVFADARPGELVCRVDRTAGVVTFPWFDPTGATGATGDSEATEATGAAGAAGAAEAAAATAGTGAARIPVVPGAGMTVRAWYRTGGGVRGNVPAGTLTVLRDTVPMPGGKLEVTNPAPAAGGLDVEPIESATRRAPQLFQARDRAVTARDYEALATRHGAVARAHAATRRSLWSFAAPGEVEIAIVPHVPTGRADRAGLAAYTDPRVLTEVTEQLRARATIGAEPVVRWAGCKPVRVLARVVARRDEDVPALQSRIVRRLEATITPLPADLANAGDFGRTLRVSNLYRTIEHEEPGVRYVDRLRVELAEVPDRDATDLVGVPSQPGCWFVAQGAALFRTVDDGAGWELCTEAAGEVRAIRPWPVRVSAQQRRLGGLVAVADRTATGSRVLLSEDLGTSWRELAAFGFGVHALAWTLREDTPVLLVAGERGLYELELGPGAVPVQNVVDPTRPDLGCYDVVAMTDLRGRSAVAVAAEGAGGVWLSTQGGTNSTFAPIRRPGEDIRSLTVHRAGPSLTLWAARSVPDGDGTGCAVTVFDEFARVDPAQVSWREFTSGWSGGSCSQVAVTGTTVYAATQSGGVLSLDAGAADPTWRMVDVNCGLPLRDRRRFTPIASVAVAEAGTGARAGAGATPRLLAAGAAGVWRSDDGGQRWSTASARLVDDVVTLPPGWLFCSGDHAVEVVAGD